MRDSTWADRVALARAQLPQEALMSGWFVVQQHAIALYAESVQDADPMHLDPDWARANTSYGGTVAAGLWVASMLVTMLHDSGLPQRIEPELGVTWGLNYGYDRLRFVAPTPVGARVRGHFHCLDLQPRGADGALLRVDARVEIENVRRPALVATWLLAYIAPEPRVIADPRESR